MTSLKCKIHKIDLKCMGGRSAHPSNWYCPTCENPEYIAKEDAARALFEGKFPVPKGVAFSVERRAYVEIPSHSDGRWPVAEKYQDRWEAWQEAGRAYAQDDSDLDQRMAAAGMIPVSQMLLNNPLGKFSAHAGVVDLASFEAWIQTRREGFIRMQARMTLDELKEDELLEWAIAHNSVLGEVMANFRQAIKGEGELGK